MVHCIIKLISLKDCEWGRFPASMLNNVAVNCCSFSLQLSQLLLFLLLKTSDHHLSFSVLAGMLLLCRLLLFLQLFSTLVCRMELLDTSYHLL